MESSLTLFPAETPAVAAPARRPRPSHSARLIAVGGGKGGIGKSLLSASLGIELAGRGRRVLMVDGDLGGANLHTCLGVTQPAAGLGEFLDRKGARLEEVAVPTGIANLMLVAGAMDPLDIANPKHAQKQRLLRAVQGYDADVVVIDIGGGTHFNVLDLFLLADHGILTLVPEPTSVENGYRFLKAAFYRRLKSVERIYGIQDLLASIGRQSGLATGPRAILAEVKQRDPQVAALLEQEMLGFRPGLVINMVRTPGDLEVGEAVVAAWRKFFGLEMDYLGCIGYDDEVWRCVRLKRPLLVQNPAGATAEAIRAIADKLLALEVSPAAGAPAQVTSRR